MIKIKFKKHLSFPKWLLSIVIIFFIVSALLVLSYFIFEYTYKNRIYPGIFLGEIELSGLTKDQAVDILNAKVDAINQNGIVFKYESHQLNLFPQIISVEGDLAYQLINFDVEKTIDSAYNFGRTDSFPVNLNDKLLTLLKKKGIKILFSINEQEITDMLENKFNEFSKPVKDAKLVYTTSYNWPYINFSVEEEEAGTKIQYEESVDILKEHLAKLNTASIDLNVFPEFPKIYKKDCLNIETKADNLLQKAPLVLNYGNKKWYINKNDLISWLVLQLNGEVNNSNEVVVGLDRNMLEYYLSNTIAPEINEEPFDAKFEIKDGRVVEFQASQDGLELNINASVQKIAYEFLANNNSQVELISKDLKSNIATETINDLGIKDIIGIGESNFSGSPVNRRHNIGVGANTLNGLLIKPDEEFSLIKALGEINKEAGYLPELVIKDNKTIPEYGGGLCQIGTTMFRAALSTGLPITMRRNHSYRVSYYEPAGTDATIYDPWPDLKFINDTPNHILIQSRIEGDNLFFDFWGTPDGRIATQTYPIISNIVRPGPTKIIETLELKPGEKKCTEHAHNGADTYFDYTVIYSLENPPADVKEKEELAEEDLVIKNRFKSHYVPWREVCLLGVEELSTEKTSSSTKETIDNDQ